MMRKYLFAVAGLVASLSFAAAQSPSQGSQFATIKTVPIQGKVAAPAPAPLAASVQQAAGWSGGTPVVVQGPGCAAGDCGPKTNKSVLHKALFIGQGCESPIGCSNLAAERTFIFGSCRQFFNPGNDCGSHAGKFGGCAGTGFAGSGGCKSCGGGGSEKHPCQGVTSYLNR